MDEIGQKFLQVVLGTLSVDRAIILEYFSEATQIGMTATPKETKYVSNIDYFGEPVYTYSLKQGIEDGFLAPYKVLRINVDKDVDGFHPVNVGRLMIGGSEVKYPPCTPAGIQEMIIRAGTVFEKTWRVLNSGTTTWGARAVPGRPRWRSEPPECRSCRSVCAWGPR